jgi:hypothetical protein
MIREYWSRQNNVAKALKPRFIGYWADSWHLAR